MARPWYKAIMERRVRLPVVGAEDGCSNGGGGPSALDMHRKRLVYRSNQPGVA
jgi:hypothetical protein